MKNAIPIVGVFFGETKWAWEEILTRKQSFMDMLVNSTSRKEPVFLKVLYTVQHGLTHNNLLSESIVNVDNKKFQRL
jgi:hypothetical protein